MKIKDGFILRTIGGENVVLPSGDDMELGYMISLNAAGRFLWEQLREDKTEEQLVDAVLASYSETNIVDAKVYVRDFINVLKENDFLV